jgi:hypothetical protein
MNLIDQPSGPPTREVSEEVVLLLSSGQTLRVRAVELYPAEQLAKIAGLRAQATQKMGGVSTGLGFIGSPGWVIGASAVLGVLEAALSESSKKQALPLLRQAEQLAAALHSQGQLCQIEIIRHIERPNPGSWTANAVVSKRVSEYSGFLGKEIYREEKVTTDLVHTGDDFLRVQTDDGLINVRWSSVVGYVAPSRANPVI